MQNMIIQFLKVVLILASMIVGIVFVGVFVEYKTLNGANIYAGVFFAFILCTIISIATYVALKEVLN